MPTTILRQNIITQFSADNEELKKKTRESEQTVNKFGISLKKALGVAAAALSVTAAVAALKRAKEVAADFEKSLSSLSSLTGATGKDLQFYRQQALLLGESTTLSGSQVLEAFKLVGSAKPELLKSKEALVATSNAAITLAEAAELDLGPAANALAGTLNQFNLSGAESNRVINALAAGSKAGSADIPQVTDAMDKFGTTAAASNITVEESVGLIELLAEKQLKGAEAGTNLRNIILKLSTIKALPKEAQDQLAKFGVNLDVVADKSLPLEDRLREIGKISQDSTALVKVFGAENVTAGQIILGNVDKFKTYTEAVTGTNTAFEQAAINTDNYQGDIKRFDSAIEGIQIRVGDFLLKGLRPFVQGATSLVLSLSQLPKFIEENRVAIGSIAAGLVLWNSQMILAGANSIRLAAIEKGRLVVTQAVTIAQNLLNAAMTANPIGLVIKGVALLVAGMGILYTKSEQVRNTFAGIGNAASNLFSVITGIFSGRLSLADAGRALAGSFTKGFNDNKTKEALKKAAKDKVETIQETVKEEELEIEIPVVPVVPTGPQSGSIKDLEDKLSKLVERYQGINTQTTKGKALARELATEIQGLTITVQRLKDEYEDSLSRGYSILPEIEDGRISDIKAQIKKMDLEISKAISEGNFDLADNLIVRRTIVENQLIKLAEIWQNPDIVTDRIKAFNQKIVEAIQTGTGDQARALIDQKRSLEAQAVALGVLSGNEKSVEEFADLAEKTITERKDREGKFIEDQKALSDKLIQEQIANRSKEREEEKIRLDERKQEAKVAAESVVTEALDFANVVTQARAEAYEQAVQTQEERVDKFARLAETGSARQLEIEQNRLDKLNAARQEAAEKERQVQQATVLASQAVTTAKTAEAISKAFAEGGPLGIFTGLAMSAALLLSLTSAVSSVGGLLGGIPAFAGGTEYLHGPGTGTSDSILMRGSKGERVVQAGVNAKMGGIPNVHLPDAVEAWRQSPAIIGAIVGQTAEQRRLLGDMIEETRWLRREMRTQTSELVMTRSALSGGRRQGMRNSRLTG